MTAHHRPESEEIAWISMVDLLVVLCCISLIVGVLVSKDNSEIPSGSQKPIDNGEQTIQDLENLADRLKDVIDDWTIANNELNIRIKDLSVETECLEKEKRELSETLKGSIAGADGERREFDKAIKNAIDEQEKVSNERDAFKEKLDVTNKVIADQAGKNNQLEKQEDQVKRELLGLPGSVSNVIFVVDRSSSMNKGGRWKDAKATIQNWIKNLPVKRAALVIFGGGVKLVPGELDDQTKWTPDMRELPIVDPHLREVMKKELAELEPLGDTPTYLALRRAMDFKEIDAIFLFTDGAPDAFGDLHGGDPCDQVLQLVKEWKGSHPRACIHVVAIGDYFNKKMSDFLLGIAGNTGGAFIGR